MNLSISRSSIQNALDWCDRERSSERPDDLQSSSHRRTSLNFFNLSLKPLSRLSISIFHVIFDKPEVQFRIKSSAPNPQKSKSKVGLNCC